MDDLKLDLRQALRSFVKNPAFTAVVVLTLALGIGANTAIFSLMDQVLLRLLPVQEPDRLVILHGPGPFSGSVSSHSNTFTPMSHPMFERLRDQNTVFAGVLAEYTRRPSISARAGRPTTSTATSSPARSSRRSACSPRSGRLFTRDDDRVPGGHPVVVLGHGFWTRRFAADPRRRRALGPRQRPPDDRHRRGAARLPRHRGRRVGRRLRARWPCSRRSSPPGPRALGDWRARWLTVMARLKDGVSTRRRPPPPSTSSTASSCARTWPRSRRPPTASASPSCRSGSSSQPGRPRHLRPARQRARRRCSCSWAWSASSCSSPARTWPTSCWRAPPRGRRRSRCGWPSAPAADGSCGSSWWRAWCSRWPGGAARHRLRRLDGHAAPARPSLRAGGARPHRRARPARRPLRPRPLALLTGIVFGLVPALQSTRPQLAPTLKSESAAVAGRHRALPLPQGPGGGPGRALAPPPHRRRASSRAA